MTLNKKTIFTGICLNNPFFIEGSLCQSASQDSPIDPAMEIAFKKDLPHFIQECCIKCR